MATKFLDVKESKKITDVNPLAMTVWFLTCLIVFATMKASLFMLFVVAFFYLFWSIVLAYPLRTIILNMRYLFTTAETLTPNHPDNEYIPNEDLLKNIRELKGIEAKAVDSKYESLPS